MTRDHLINFIKASDPFYEGISYEQLSEDDLLVIKLSIEANSQLYKGLAEKRTLEFQKQKTAVLLNTR